MLFFSCHNLKGINVSPNHKQYSSQDGVLYNKKMSKLIVCPGAKTDLTIPNSVTRIESFSFSGCTSLTNVAIPDSVVEIGESAFLGCECLTGITIPDHVKTIDESAFQDCKKMTEFVIPNGVTKIEDCTFSGCTSLTNVVIPDSVGRIGWGAFSGCECLTGITIPDRVKTIDESAFQDCKKMTEFVIPNGVTKIEDCTFSGCTSLTNVVIPDSVKRIGRGVFSGCINLTNIPEKFYQLLDEDDFETVMLNIRKKQAEASGEIVESKEFPGFRKVDPSWLVARKKEKSPKGNYSYCSFRFRGYREEIDKLVQYLKTHSINIVKEKKIKCDIVEIMISPTDTVPALIEKFPALKVTGLAEDWYMRGVDTIYSASGYPYPTCISYSGDFDPRADGGYGRWAYKGDMVKGISGSYYDIQTSDRIYVSYCYSFKEQWDNDQYYREFNGEIYEKIK